MSWEPDSVRGARQPSRSVNNSPLDFSVSGDGALKVRPGDLHDAASVTRGMDELRAAQQQLAEFDFGAAHLAGGAVHDSTDDPDVRRHSTRGTALAFALIQHSSTLVNSGDFFDDLAKGWPSTPARKRAFEDIRDLAATRQRANTDGEAKQTLPRRISDILRRAGLAESEFELAVSKLTGLGLEEATSAEDAKFGAAVLCRLLIADRQTIQ